VGVLDGGSGVGRRPVATARRGGIGVGQVVDPGDSYLRRCTHTNCTTSKASTTHTTHDTHTAHTTHDTRHTTHDTRPDESGRTSPSLLDGVNVGLCVVVDGQVHLLELLAQGLWVVFDIPLRTSTNVIISSFLGAHRLGLKINAMRRPSCYLALWRVGWRLDGRGLGR
jgi:hypothetical protein